MKNKPKLGQNFLIDPAAQQRIVAALGEAARGTVVEIGPGGAAITSLLAELAEQLIAIEVDPRLVLLLRERFAADEHVAVLAQDVLQVDITALAPDATRKVAVLGNLPYYITSPILHHLFEHSTAISRAVVMVQREVAERMTAEPGTSEYGLLSVVCRLHAEMSCLFTLPPSAFQPAPQVESAVVRMEFRSRWEELGLEQEGFLLFLRTSFAQKRKTIANNLRSGGVGDAAEALQSCGIDPRARAESLSVETLAQLWHHLRSRAVPSPV